MFGYLVQWNCIVVELNSHFQQKNNSHVTGIDMLQLIGIFFTIVLNLLIHGSILFCNYVFSQWAHYNCTWQFYMATKEQLISSLCRQLVTTHKKEYKLPLISNWHATCTCFPCIVDGLSSTSRSIMLWLGV